MNNMIRRAIRCRVKDLNEAILELREVAFTYAIKKIRRAASDFSNGDALELVQARDKLPKKPDKRFLRELKLRRALWLIEQNSVAMVEAGLEVYAEFVLWIDHGECYICLFGDCWEAVKGWDHNALVYVPRYTEDYSYWDDESGPSHEHVSAQDWKRRIATWNRVCWAGDDETTMLSMKIISHNGEGIYELAKRLYKKSPSKILPYP